MRRPRKRRRKRSLPCAWPTVGRVMPGQLHAAAEEAALGGRGVPGSPGTGTVAFPAFPRLSWHPLPPG